MRRIISLILIIVFIASNMILFDASFTFALRYEGEEEEKTVKTMKRPAAKTKPEKKLQDRHFINADEELEKVLKPEQEIEQKAVPKTDNRKKER